MRKHIVIGSVVALAASTAACGGSDSDSGTGQQVKSGGTFTHAIAADPGTLDIFHSPMAVTQVVAAYAYNTLISVDGAGAVRPWLAQKWDVTPTAITYTLKPGITCSDGSPLTASDVARNFTYIADPKNTAMQLGGQVTAGTKATADDQARTVTVTSPTPDSFLLVKSGNVMIVCAKGLDNPQGLTDKTIGTGLFELASVAPTTGTRSASAPGTRGASTASPATPPGCRTPSSSAWSPTRPRRRTCCSAARSTRRRWPARTGSAWSGWTCSGRAASRRWASWPSTSSRAARPPTRRSAGPWRWR
ncbi:hypothetical protein Prum_099440 [Phytohabitans rumicis]|uniref:Solute-binding protein family 5 domain-containing protein n=1 Tax=Phytohabitans rumicis TaxID=1076125 RepID=A0A6V8LGB5_9ACTN|nr:hypothetical protein Prum_099440 [Phytohabitans rumicis]